MGTTHDACFLALPGRYKAPGGWRWTSHSPTGSGPEGSSPNERGSGRSSASTLFTRATDERRDDTDRSLPRAGAQVPAVDLRRPDRPGRHGAHRLECVRGRPHPAGLDPHRRARRRQDHDGAHPRPRAQLRAGGRLGDRADHHDAGTGRALPADHGNRHLDVIEMDAASHNGVDDVRAINDAVPTRRSRRATRSISSTKCTCCPAPPSMRC